LTSSEQMALPAVNGPKAAVPPITVSARPAAGALIRQLDPGMELPSLIEFTLSRVPAELQQRPQWVAWRFVRNRGGGKPWKKVPVDVRTGGPAMTNDPETWSSFKRALKYYLAYQDNPDPRLVAHGIGYMLQPQDGIVGGDLDHCIDEGGRLSPFASGILEFLGPTYVEVSPSGTGLHFFGFGSLGAGRNRNEEHGLELYQDRRFLTITGCCLGDLDALQECAVGLANIERAYLARLGVSTSSELGEGVHIAGSNHSGGVGDGRSISPNDRRADYRPRTESQVVRLIKHDWKAGRLWAGETSMYRTPSNADAALVEKLLFYGGKDKDFIDGLFRKSPLYRPKWDESRGEAIYGVMTITKVDDWMERNPLPSSMSTNSRLPCRARSEKSIRAICLLHANPNAHPSEMARQLEVSKSYAKDLRRRVRRWAKEDGGLDQLFATVPVGRRVPDTVEQRSPDRQRSGREEGGAGTLAISPAEEVAPEDCQLNDDRTVDGQAAILSVDDKASLNEFRKYARTVCDWRPCADALKRAYTLSCRYADCTGHSLTLTDLKSFYDELIAWRKRKAKIAGKHLKALNRRCSLGFICLAMRRIEERAGGQSEFAAFHDGVQRYIRNHSRYRKPLSSVLQLYLDLVDWAAEQGQKLKVAEVLQFIRWLDKQPRPTLRCEILLRSIQTVVGKRWKSANDANAWPFVFPRRVRLRQAKPSGAKRRLPATSEDGGAGQGAAVPCPASVRRNPERDQRSGLSWRLPDLPAESGHFRGR
jgi:hypothetical protein